MRLTMATLLLAMAVPAASQPGPSGWEAAPAFLDLFAPAGPRAERYRAYVTPLDLDTVLARLEVDASLVRTSGAWRPHALLPLDAFGQTGSYDRWALVRLYGASRPRVVRGPRREDGQITESWTLISPYPDTTLQRLEPGTLLMVLRLGS
jgi:hypothetical protein